MVSGDLHDELSAMTIITGVLGEAFSFQTLIDFIELYRGKELRIEQELMPVALTGYGIALADVDLIRTRLGLDPILMRAVCLHEMAHFLLGHIPLQSAGSSTPTYEVFKQGYDISYAVRRDHAAAYDSPQERGAETLATLLLQCITKEQMTVPLLIRELYPS